MARPLRIEYPGACYHVLNRGRRKERVFFEEKDYFFFLKLLGKASDLYKCKIHAYALMSNHYHLLITTPEGNISRVMRFINSLFTQYINRTYDYQGTLFQGRYKAIIVEEESYLLELVRYIHRNPYKAGLEKNIGEYRWSSHRAYLQENLRPKWLNTNDVLSRFSKYEKEAMKKLDLHVNKQSASDLEETLDGLKWPSVLGGDTFKEHAKEMLLGKKLDCEQVPEVKKYTLDIDLENILELIEKSYHLEKGSLKKKKRYVDQKRAFIFIAREDLQKNLSEIRVALGNCSLSSVSKGYTKAHEEFQKKSSSCYDNVVKIRKLMSDL